MTSPVTQITDFVQRMQEDRLGQFWGDEVTGEWVAAIATEIQRVENLIYAMATNTLLDNATGEILNWIGGIVRVSRLGRTDADYRKIIQVAIAANDSDGGAEQIIWIASQLVNADVRYVQEGTARFRLDYFSDDTLSDELKAEALDLIGRAAPAGVAWTLQASEAGADEGEFDVSTFGAGTFGTVIGQEP